MALIPAAVVALRLSGAVSLAAPIDSAVLRWGEAVAISPIPERPGPLRPRRGWTLGSRLGGGPLSDVSRRIIATAESLGWSHDPGTLAPENLRPPARLRARAGAKAPAPHRSDPPNPIRPPTWLGKLAWLLKLWLLRPLAARLIGTP